MDEHLHDTFEDWTFMEEINDDAPKATKEWIFPSTEKLNSFLEEERNQLAKKNNKILENDSNNKILTQHIYNKYSIEGICSNPLGFYLFLKFCKRLATKEGINLSISTK